MQSLVTMRKQTARGRSCWAAETSVSLTQTGFGWHFMAEHGDPSVVASTGPSDVPWNKDEPPGARVSTCRRGAAPRDGTRRRSRESEVTRRRRRRHEGVELPGDESLDLTSTLRSPSSCFADTQMSSHPRVRGRVNGSVCHSSHGLDL